MGDVMNFPERIEDFIEQYSFRDDERTYTNGSKLIPVFRVKQAIEHYMPKWIPCSERLPELTIETADGFLSSDVVLVTTVDGYGFITSSVDFLIGNMWATKMRNEKVIAWMPLPKPYRPEKEGE